MRVFACSLLSPDAQALCRRQIERVISASGGLLRSVPPGSAHLTHAFVSHAPDDRIAELIGAIETVAARHRAFDIRFDTPFVLYGGSEARLVCAPVTSGIAALSSLAADCVGELTGVLSRDAVSSSKSQHVTLARFRKRTPRREGRQIEKHLSGIASYGDRVTRLQLMVSQLAPAGPVYTPLVDAALGVSETPRRPPPEGS